MNNKKHQKRKALKTHVKSKGNNQDFEVTPAFCYHWWHTLNNTVFDNQLTAPHRFEIKAYRQMAGWCKPFAPNRKKLKVTIGINSKMPDRKTFLNTLVHEMVHQFQWEVINEWNVTSKRQHGVQFFAWEDKIKNRANLELSTSIPFG